MLLPGLLGLLFGLLLRYPETFIVDRLDNFQHLSLVNKTVIALVIPCTGLVAQFKQTNLIFSLTLTDISDALTNFVNGFCCDHWIDTPFSKDILVIDANCLDIPSLPFCIICLTRFICSLNYSDDRGLLQRREHISFHHRQTQTN